jgi:tetratricopeptide (TPR) repeat protein
MCLVLILMKKITNLSFILLIFPLVLAACNTISTTSDGDIEHVNKMQSSELTDAGSATEGARDGQQVKLQDAGTTAVTESSNQADMDGDMLYYLLAAEFAGNVGDVEASLNFYRQASVTAKDSRIAARSAYIALYGKDYEELLNALDRWSELAPGSDELPLLYATAYLKLEQAEEAVPYIEEMLSSSAESEVDEALVVKQLLAQESSTKTAYVVLQKLNENEGHNRHLLILQSRYAAELKQYDESIALLDQVLLIDPSLTEVLVIKARILIAQGKTVQASQLIEQLVDEYPDNDALRLQFARMLVEQRELQAATAHYEILFENVPEDGDIALSLALLYIETKQLDKAVEVMKYLLTIGKKIDIANYYLGRISQNQGHDKQAINYYLQVNSGEYVFDAQLRVGVLLAISGAPDEGLKKLEALAESQIAWSLRVQAYLAQGEVLRSEGRYKEGVEMFSRALQNKRDDINLLYARGLMAEKVDRLDMAEADLLKVISKEPENANALNALGYTLADRTSRYEEALEYIKRAAELVPDDPAILDSLGWVSYRLGKLDEAVMWLSRAFEKLEDAEIAAHYGEVLWYSDQKDKAREVWEKGMSLNAKNPVLVETLHRLKP